VLLVVVAAVGGCNAQDVLSFDDPDSGAPYAKVTVDGEAAPVDATLTFDAAPTPEAMPAPEIGLDAERFFHPDRGDASRGGVTDAGADGDNQGLALSQCRDESDCALAGLHCSLADAGPGVCVACVRNADCSDPVLKICDLTLNRCVQCDVMSDCKAGEICLADITHTCIPSCANMQMCPQVGASYCDTTRNVCLSCRNDADCDPGQICDLVSGRCGECAVNKDCPRKPYVNCDPTTSRCVECLRNSDCGKGVCNFLGICIGSSPPTLGKGDE
jgi:Cys-rich repeat protein